MNKFEHLLLYMTEKYGILNNDPFYILTRSVSDYFKLCAMKRNISQDVRHKIYSGRFIIKTISQYHRDHKWRAQKYIVTYGLKKPSIYNDCIMLMKYEEFACGIEVPI